MKKLVITLVMFLGIVSIWADDFKVGGIYYDVVSFSDLTCKVANIDDYVEDVVIPATVEYNKRTFTVINIGMLSLAHKSNIRSVTIGSNVVEVERCAFQDSRNIKKVIIEDSDKPIHFCHQWDTDPSYGDYMFYDSNLEEVYVGRMVTFDAYEFITMKYFSPFCEQLSLKKITIGGSMVEVPKFLFWACGNIESISLGSEVRKIGLHAFIWATHPHTNMVYEVYSYNPQPPEIEGDIFLENAAYLDATLYIPQGSEEAYAQARIWQNFLNVETVGIQPPVPEKVPEDLNGDGVVDTQDVLKIYKYIQEH